MNQFVPSLRRVSAAVVAIMLLSALSPALSRAQSDAKPADPAAATGKAADAGKTAKVAKEKPAKAPEKSFEEQKKEDGVYMKGSDWISGRFGWAKRTGEFNGDGLVGYGVGYQHMINRRLAFAAGANHDVVGHFGPHLDQTVSFTGEFQRHFRWKSGVRPYIGLGGGYYVEKYYRTGDDHTSTTGGPHLSLGFTSQIDDRHVIGLEMRGARLKGRPGITNPTFGPQDDSEIIWTIKGSWAIAYQ